MKKSEIRFEIKFCEGILKRAPYFEDALILLGDLYTRIGEYEKGLAIDEKLVQLRPYDPVVLYNLACSYSLMNEVNKALRTIKLAVKYGYHDFKHLDKDKDLANLRKDKRFQRFIKKFFPPKDVAKKSIQKK